MQRQTKPVIFRAVGFDELDLVPAAKAPDPERSHRIDAMPHSHGTNASAKFFCFRENFAFGIADEPGLMAVRVQPVDFEAGPIFLPAPTAATFEVKNVHDSVVRAANNLEPIS